MIGEILAGKALDLVLRGGKAAVDRLLEYPPPKQLLAILYEEYGKRTGLSRKEFYSWLEVEELRDAIQAALDGDLIDGEGGLLQELVAPRLHNTPTENQQELAGEIATSIVRLAPWVQRELREGITHLSHKMDQQFKRLLEAVGAADAQGSPSSATEALLRGPLVQIGRAAEAQQARELAEAGDPASAAELFVEIATCLQAAELSVVGETYLQLAGELYAEAGDGAAAAQAISEVAEAQVSRGTIAARFSIKKLRETLPAEQEWQADALEARIDFPEDLGAALGALRTAAEKGRNSENSLKYLAEYTDLLAFAGNFKEILVLTAGSTVCQPANEYELRVYLNHLDALESEESLEASAPWNELLLLLDQGTEPLWTGLAWQRRGASLARAGEVDRCQDAYRRAMAAFSRVPGYQEQAADAFYSMQLAVIMNAAGFPETELRALAYEQRGSAEAPVARAERLARQGMDNRIAGKLPDALRNYALALELHRRSGSLQGQLEVSEKLGELFLEADRPGIAIGFYIAAGKSKEAAAAAQSASSAEIAATLRATGSRWERSATFAVLAEAGDRLPPTTLAEVGPRVIAEAEREPDGFHAPQPAHQARLALATILLGMPDDQRDSALAVVNADLSRGPFDVIQAAGQSLAQATSVGLTDATEPLVRAFLADPYNSHISIEFLAERVKDDESARRAIEEAAEESVPALAVLSLADLVEGNEQLKQAADQAAQSLSKAINVERTQNQISVGNGRKFAEEAIAAAGASDEARRAAVTRLLEIVNDPADSELNRWSAANALFNLGDAMPPDLAESVVAQLRAPAMGEYSLSQWDQNIDDPLSRFQISIHTPAALHSAAIGAISRILGTHPTLPREPLAEAVTGAYQRGPDVVIAAATEALARVTNLDLPVPIEALLSHGDAGIRLSALRCWNARNQSLPPQKLIDSLMKDESLAVRHTLLMSAFETEERGVLEQLAAEDESALIRRSAEKRLSELDSLEP